jgi:lysophospholipase L1-like esterase
MIGDSITWAGQGDWWRRHLIERVPTLAFVGTHSARFGYSHAGEGGDSTTRVLRRLEDIPDCANYHLMIGINDSSAAKSAGRVDEVAEGTADRIMQIVEELLAKPSCERVFLASILPAHTDNPFRDAAGSRTNELLRRELRGGALDGERIVWVEYERPIRAMDGWEPLMKLHPTPDGYAVIADITAAALREELGLSEEIATPEPLPGCGVRVVNLWDPATKRTTRPIIAGWYTLSLDVTALDGDAPTVTILSAEDVEEPLKREFALPDGCVGGRVSFEFFTGAERYGYTRSVLGIETDGGQIARVLLEKKRPGDVASTWGEGSYLDVTTAPAPGELLECAEED